MNSEIQISLKFQQNAYVYLKEYPNRALLGRAKIITFHNNENLFQQRCSLFVEFCCMLFRIQMQKSDVFVSKNVFIDYNHLIFMLYSDDKSHQGKLKKISHGNLISNINSFYRIIFLRQIVKINDYQHNFIYQNMQEIINSLFELKDKSEQGYYQQSKENSSSIEEMLINNPISIMKKLKNSHVFSEYFYLLKVNKAIIINVLLSNISNSENQNINGLHYIYSELNHIEKNLFKIIKKSQFIEDVKDGIFSYQKKFIELLKLIQHQNYITLYKIQDQNRSNKIYNLNVLDLEICSNFRKLPSCPQTTGQRSTESSVCEDNELGTKEQKEEKKRQRDLFQSIKRFENQINFRIEVTCNLQKRYFVVEVEGVSQWCLDESLYSHLFDMFTELGNSWHNQLLEHKQEILQQLKPFKLQMLKKNKNIIIRQTFKVQQGRSLTLQILVLIDKITMAFLLIQRNFKHLYKITHNIMLSNEQYFKDIKNREYISNLIKLHKQALRMYSRLYSHLNLQEKYYYK